MGVYLLTALKMGFIELIGLRPDAFGVSLWIATIVTFSEGWFGIWKSL